MYINDGYISTNQSYSEDCICIDVQLYQSLDLEIFDEKMLVQAKIFGKKTELNTSSYSEYIPKANIGIKEAISWINSGLLALYILVLILSKRYIAIFGHMLFSSKNVIYSDFPQGFKFITNTLALFSVFIITTFVYLLETHIHALQQISLELLLTIIAVALAYVLLKTLCIKIIGYVFENDELKSKIYAIETTILGSYGLFAGFFLILCFFNKDYNINTWLIIVSAILGLLYLVKISRLVMIFIEGKISSFFLILYLCALEILPIWLIIDFL